MPGSARSSRTVPESEQRRRDVSAQRDEVQGGERQLLGLQRARGDVGDLADAVEDPRLARKRHGDQHASLERERGVGDRAALVRAEDLVAAKLVGRLSEQRGEDRYRMNPRIERPQIARLVGGPLDAQRGEHAAHEVLGCVLVARDAPRGADGDGEPAAVGGDDAKRGARHRELSEAVSATIGCRLRDRGFGLPVVRM